MKQLTYLLVALSGCSTFRVNTPPIAVHTSVGEVRAHTSEEAASVATQLQDLDPKVRQLLDSANTSPARVYLIDHPLPGDRDACVYEDMILLTKSSSPLLQLTLAHELVHWHAIEPWTRLPSIVGEGLAELVTALLSTECGSIPGMARTFSIRRAANPDPKLILRMSNEDLHEARGEDANICYGVGLVVASEIGIEGLHALCVRARDEGLDQVPLDWLFAASGLSDTDMRKWPIRGKGPLPPSYFEREQE